MTEEILTSLLTTAGLNVYALALPQDGTAVLPSAVYQRISTRQFRHMGGNGLTRPRMQITAWGETYQDSLNAADAVKTALDLNATDFELAVKENEIHTLEVEPGLWATRLDFLVLVNE
jgi:hypothetical protein